jgi:hypothetical protein
MDLISTGLIKILNIKIASEERQIVIFGECYQKNWVEGRLTNGGVTSAVMSPNS